MACGDASLAKFAAATFTPKNELSTATLADSASRWRRTGVEPG